MPLRHLITLIINAHLLRRKTPKKMILCALPRFALLERVNAQTNTKQAAANIRQGPF